jgi:formiminotetrahydrofolate cyclodeaminase
VFSEKSIRQFADELASGEPVPGGGSTAALAGALGAGLVSMVCNLTIGREKFRDAEAEMKEVLGRSEELRLRLLDLLEADTQVYSKVIGAYRLPRATPEEKQARSRAIQAALRAAAGVPLEVARASAKVIELCPTAAKVGNPSAISDAACGALLAESAFEGGALNVETNLGQITDAAFGEAARCELAELRAKVETTTDEAVRIVRQRLG